MLNEGGNEKGRLTEVTLTEINVQNWDFSIAPSMQNFTFIYAEFIA